ncbi:MAG: UDP-N-acetylmuramate--L-alanine ligase [bacterium]|jgi:UDP-N-acetylmuramate--alanine ligase|nr:MAG: UDP-N-acetylmuramate--L-alanine ligase [bacterium]
MSAPVTDIDLRELARSRPVHFMGVTGAGMSALAELLLRSGGKVTGCDAHPGPAAAALRALGLEVAAGHDPAHVEDAAAVVVTAAVPPDHPELAAARAGGIPVLKRAQALGAVVNRGVVVAVAGTHGKTTTTAMTTAILAEAGLDPTGFVGGRMAAWNGGLRPGSDRLFVVEADEYDRSFLTLRPRIAVVTAVEADHLDVYGSLEAIEEAFLQFLAAVPADGLIAACVDDDGARRVLGAVRGARTLGYGLSRAAELRATNVEPHGRGSRFRVEEGGTPLTELTLRLPGLHNVRNALGALAAARAAGAAVEAAQRALATFEGVDRRFQELGQAGGVVFVDDYAHHPTEITATLAAARAAYPGRRIVAVFQPHLYTRTRDFADAFGRALAGADVAWVTDIYPAREAPIPGVTGELVARAVEAAGGSEVHYHADRGSLAEALAAALEPGDVCITLGAGNIDETGRETLALLGGSAAAGAREQR